MIAYVGLPKCPTHKENCSGVCSPNWSLYKRGGYSVVNKLLPDDEGGDNTEGKRRIVEL